MGSTLGVQDGVGDSYRDIQKFRCILPNNDRK